MNILFTESSPNIGGQELQSLIQMTALKNQGHFVLLACRKKSKIAAEAKELGIDIIFIPFRNSIHIPSIIKMCRVVRSFNPNIVVCHSGHDSNIVGICRYFFCRRRFLIVRQKTYITKKTKTFSLNYLCKAIIVPSTAMQTYLKSKNVRTPITVVTPGFDFLRLRNDFMQVLPSHILTWLASAEKVPIITQVGMLRPEKGHEFMLHVLHQLKQEGKKFRWLIIGSGDEEIESNLQLLIKNLGMNDDVLMAGSLFPALPVYRISSLVVMPSKSEAFGMVIAEASAFEVPVFASNIGGIPDIIQHNVTGTLLPVDDLSAWKEALNDFLCNPEHFRTMAAKAREDIECRFNINTIVNNIIKLAELRVKNTS
ncbi:glycosyltransferase [Escherichia coli]|uniref:glycosyltransferase family 4 protein n=4 Tax=Escherichia coli TaxID=562 RepID=UPI0013258AC7|nr:glycosyltransferase family 4 protein [Escherichia coli]EME0105375.1 glycosyltransferase family 4 protein [Escherichia coli]MVX71727.1 glycosyltransferase [Escherichia coli]MVX76364.1 glycosyltransferase [Escherichia coli]MZQ02131.1 glycosyltransferase [Escherichia coli]MZQ21686.1 glycosyltransferase [Escherichia coli]